MQCALGVVAELGKPKAEVIQFRVLEGERVEVVRKIAVCPGGVTGGCRQGRTLDGDFGSSCGPKTVARSYIRQQDMSLFSVPHQS